VADLPANTVAVNIAGLLDLANILDLAHEAQMAHRVPPFTMRIETHDCGAPACAWGHYALSTPERIERFVKPGYDGSASANYNDARTEFRLSRQDWSELFEQDGCGEAKTAKQAADYIRAFVSRTQKEVS
jgi:hypothetical protein